MELDWVKLGEYAAALSAVVAGLSIIYRYLIIPIHKIYKKSKLFIQKIDSAIPVLFDISEQFKPNGGNSLRDVLNRMEISFERTQLKTRLILDHLAIGVFETDANGYCMWVNSIWSQLTDMTSEESTGNGWILAVHPEDRTLVFEEWYKAIEQKRDFSLDYRFVDKKGNVIKVHGTSSAIKDRTGRIVSHLGCVTRIRGA